jgi:flagellar biosynthesis protein FlhG
MNGVDRQASGLALQPAHTAPWIAVAGAKGGVGKTTLAVNLAILLARAGYRPLLADRDPGGGNVSVHLRLAGRRDLEDAVAGQCTGADAVLDGPGGTRVLLGRTASTTFAASGVAIDGALAALADAARSSNVVVCDTGAGIGPMTLAVAARSRLALCVTTPDAPSLTDAYALCKVMHVRGMAMPQLVVNRVRSRDEAMRTAGKLAAVARKFLDREVRLCGWVGDNARVADSIALQRPLALGEHGAISEDLRGLCAAVLAGLPPLPRERTTRLRPPAVGA